MRRVTIDFETLNEEGVDVRDVGAEVYARHPVTDVICLSYKINTAGTRVWAPSLGLMPDDLRDAIERGFTIDAHNVSFERAIWREVMVPKYGWIELPEEQLDDTMAVAAYKALPMALEDGARVLGLRNQKDKDGHRVMLQLTKPRKPTKNNPHRMHGRTEGLNPKEADKELTRLQKCFDYCAQDTETEHELREVLGELPAYEKAVWRLDQKINLRGVKADRQAVVAANAMIDRLEAEGVEQMKELTGGKVTKTGDVKGIRAFAEANGIYLPNLTKDTLEATIPTLDPDNPATKVLKVRQLVGKASVKKVRAMLKCMCPDDRIRFILAYHAAGTGRWAGRLVQPQNFPRPFGQWEDIDPYVLIEDVKSGDIDYLTMLYGDPVEAISQALKPMFVAGEGRKYACADLSAIEGVVTATLAGERWKIEAFETIARGEKYNGADDIYCATAAKILGHTVTKKDNPGDRQKWGKVPELAFGYQGGVGAWRQFDKSDDLTDMEIDVIKNSWRAEHPATKELWRACQDAFLRAVKERETVETHGCVFRMRGDFMTIMLPSGRLLWYYRPEVKLGEAPWSTEDDPAYTYTVYYWTMSAGPGGSRRWMKVHTYGGKIVENIVQAIARDIMVLGMFAAEEHRLPVILTVHDEILTEPREDDVEATAALLVRLMCRRPAWFRNCPIAAEGWEGPRWKK